jgi:putative ABC transport system ATP-binding protein
MLEMHAITKVYGEGRSSVEALKHVDLRVARGEFVSIMGPSGSGKSTLLNLASALDLPSSGRIRIADQDISQLDDDSLTLFRRRKIGLIFQFFNLLPTLSALENTLLPVMLERRASAADERRALELLERVGLEARSAHHIQQLSGGEMQRVAIARALMLEPALLLADEPTGNLDSATGDSILQLLKETCLRHTTTIIMVTHNESAAQVGDRVLWLKDGRIVRDEATAAPPITRAAE